MNKEGWSIHWDHVRVSEESYRQIWEYNLDRKVENGKKSETREQ